MLNFEHLIHFLEAAKQKNLTRTAERFFISHSTISRNISSLEKYFGVPLMIRTKKEIKLTEAGELLVEKAEKLRRQAELLEKEMKEIAAGHSGKLSVLTQKLGNEALFVANGKFKRQQKNVHLSVMTSEVEPMKEALKNGETDLIVLLDHHLNENDGYEFMVMGEDEFCLLISSRHPVAKETEISIAQLNELDIPVFRLGALMELMGKEIPKRLNSEAEEHESWDVETTYIGIRSGHVAAILPKSIAKEHQTNCCMLDISDLNCSKIIFRIIAAWRKENQNPCLKLFLETLKNVVEKFEISES